MVVSNMDLGNSVRGNHEECGSWKLENIQYYLSIDDLKLNINQSKGQLL
jgi:hypothetical protein